MREHCIIHKPVKQEKYNTLKLLIQSMLDSKADIISQAIPDRTSHPLKFIVLQVVEKDCKLKDIIRSQAKTKVKQILKEHREELLEQRRKKDREDLFRKSYPGCQCDLKKDAILLQNVILSSIKTIKLT